MSRLSRFLILPLLLLPLLLVQSAPPPAAAQRITTLSSTAHTLTGYLPDASDLPAGARVEGEFVETTNENLVSRDPDAAALILRHGRITDVSETVLRTGRVGSTVLTVALFRDADGAWNDALDSTFPEGVTPSRTLPGPEIGERSVVFTYQRGATSTAAVTLLVFQRGRFEVAVDVSSADPRQDLEWALQLGRLVDARILDAPSGPPSAEELASLDTSPAAVVRGAARILADRFYAPLEMSQLLTDAWNGAARALGRAGAGNVPGAPAYPADDDGAIALHMQMFPTLQQLAAGRLTDQQLTSSALIAMAAARQDCHTGYLTPEAWQATKADLTGGESVAFGLGFATDPPLRIVYVRPGSPAKAAGLRRGQVIVSINGRSTDGLSVGDARNLLDRREGAPNVLIVRNPSGSTSEVRVAPAAYRLPVLESEILPGNIGLIRFYSFPTNTLLLEQIRATLTDFEAKGVQGWIIDIRDNPGGLEPVAITSLFVQQGKLFGYIPRSGRPIYRNANGDPLPFQRPLVFLVGSGSGSAAEFLPGALQARGRAVVVGEPTAGCVGSTNFFGLMDGSVLQVTLTEGVVGPDDLRLNGRGVTPNVMVDPPTPADDEAGVDPQLQAALRVMSQLASGTPAAAIP